MRKTVWLVWTKSKAVKIHENARQQGHNLITNHGTAWHRDSIYPSLNSETAWPDEQKYNLAKHEQIMVKPEQSVDRNSSGQAHLI